MNTVDEPGSRTMSKNRLRNNTESNRIENRPSAPSAQPVSSPYAQVARQTPRPRACRALPHAPRAPYALLPPAYACAQLPLACRARAFTCASLRAHAREPTRSRAPVCAHACAPQRPAYCITTRLPVSYHDTPGCIAIQPGLLQPFQPQYSAVYCNTLLPNKLY